MKPSRLDHLDGLRGVASLIVLLAHYVLAFEPALYYGRLFGTPATLPWAPAIAGTPLIVVFSPQLGVAVFFVLSGFVLARGMVRRPAPWGELAVRRWIRLTLPILGSSMLIWCWLETGFHPDLALAHATGSQWLGMNYAWTAIRPNEWWTMLSQSIVGVYAFAQDDWNVSLWTMPIEFWCSLALYAAYLIATRAAAGHRLRLLIAVAAMAAAWNRDSGGFAMGAALFELSQSGRTFRPLAWIVGAILLLAGLALGGAPYWAPVPTVYWSLSRYFGPVASDPIHMMHRMAAMCLVAATLLWPPMRWLLGGAVGRWLGRVSFMTYLLHVPIISAVGAWLVLRLTATLGYDGAVTATLPLVLAATLGAATLASRWIDRPSIRAAHVTAAWVVGAVSAAMSPRRSAGAP